MEVIRAQANGLGEVGELGLGLRRLDQAAGFAYLLGVLVDERWLRRLAALARAEPRLLRGFRRLMEADISAVGAPRGARWAAIDAGGANRKDEAAIRCGVAGHHRGPARLIVG